MKIFSICSLCLLLFSCSSTSNQVVSQNYVHKYGFALSPKEWVERDQDGKIVSLLENGVSVSQSFENGTLHGPTTYSYPESEIIEQLWLYDQGDLLKITQFDKNGIPIREEFFELDNRKTISLWDEKGAPMSIEEYEEDKLLQGSYFTPENELESIVENGHGIRTKRNREGLLLLKDQIEEGELLSRTSFHPNAEVQTITFYDHFLPHGEMMEYTPYGELHQITHWKSGTLEGMKILYRNGKKIREIPYVDGKKEGIERSFDSDGTILSEVEYKNDEKHGQSIVYEGKSSKTEWFYHGTAVNEKKFVALESSDALLEELERHFE